MPQLSKNVRRKSGPGAAGLKPTVTPQQQQVNPRKSAEKEKEEEEPPPSIPLKPTRKPRNSVTPGPSDPCPFVTKAAARSSNGENKKRASIYSSDSEDDDNEPLKKRMKTKETKKAPPPPQSSDTEDEGVSRGKNQSRTQADGGKSVSKKAGSKEKESVPKKAGSKEKESVPKKAGSKEKESVPKKGNNASKKTAPKQAANDSKDSSSEDDTRYNANFSSTRSSKSSSASAAAVQQSRSRDEEEMIVESDKENTSQSLILSPEVELNPRATSSLRATGSGATSVTSVEGTDASSSMLSSECSMDPNDPDWFNFLEIMKDTSNTAHQRLAENLMNSSNNNGPALLGKLIYRSVSQVDHNDSNSRKECDKYGVMIIKAILDLVLQNDGYSGLVVDFVNMLFTELRHFRTPVLYHITEYCLEHMKKQKDNDGSLPHRWIEIFGKIAHLLSTRGDIKHETDVLNGKEYREYLIREMCSTIKWTTENTASLIAVLREIPDMSDEDLKVVLMHIKSILKHVKPSSFPPVAHQVILLAGKRCPSDVLELCATYFQNAKTSEREAAGGSKKLTEATQMRNAMGVTVIYFLDAATQSDVLVRAVLKVVKTSFFDFGNVMSPFILSVVLGLTSHDYARRVIIDPLRNSIMKTLHSNYLSELSYWYRHKVGDSRDSVTEAFKPILESKSNELEDMIQGLLDLGIGLLNADLYQSRYPNTLERCQKLGFYLITSLVKTFPDKLSSIMNALLKVCSRSVVHTQCLARCLEMRTRQIIHPSIIGKTCDIIRHLPLMDSVSAAIIVKSLSSAFNLSYMLLDQLMLILRKTIWKSVEARRTCAKIMVILLSNSRVVGDIPFSQYSESQRFYESQNQPQSSTSSNSSLPDNQPLCIEILALAKRCFTHQGEIRQELYLGFHTVVRKNPGLCELICMHLYKHANQYFREQEENAEDGPSTLMLGKVLEWPAEGALFMSPVVKEELGFLVQCLGFVVHKSHLAFHSLDDGPPAAVEKLEEVINRWVKIISKMEPNNIEIAAADAMITGGAGGTTRPLDSVRYVETIFALQTMQTIEALIEFLNLENKTQNSKKVRKLFEKHAAIEQILKKEKEKPPVGGKKGKGEKGKGKGNKSKKGGDDDEVTVLDDTASECSTNAGGAAGMKLKKLDATPKKVIYFHIMTLESALDMLRKLQKSEDDRGAMRVMDQEFEKFLLNVVKQKLTSFKRKEPLHERRRPIEKVVEIFADIAGCIWNGLLLHNPEETESDAPTDMVELRMEVVNEIVTLLCTSHQSVCNHLINVLTDDESEGDYDTKFPKLFKSWQTVLGWIPPSPESDNGIRLCLFDILHAFAKPLSPDSDERDHAKKVLKWVWNWMSSTTEKVGKAEFLLAEAVLGCFLTYYMKGKDYLETPEKRHQDVVTLAMGVYHQLGQAEEATQAAAFDDSNRVKMWIINEDTAPTILCAIMNHLELLLEHITAVLTKVKFNQNDDSTIQNNIGRIRGSCFVKIEEIISVCSQLVSSNFPASLCCTTMLKVVPKIFTLMTGFGEYFSDLIRAKRPCSLKMFAKPVAKIAKEFKPLVEAMISHVERVQRDFAEDQIKKAVSNNKKKGAANRVPQAVKNQLLKEKRLIPNFIYVIEKYDQQIIALSKKTDAKNKLLVGMKLSTAHDFKIHTDKFSEAMNHQARSVQEITTVPDEESMEAAEAADVPGPSRKKAAKPRAKTSRKRKTPENEEEGEAGEDEEQ